MRKEENIIYGKLVRKTLHCSHSWPDCAPLVCACPAPGRVPASPEPCLGEAGDTHCCHQPGLGAAGPLTLAAEGPRCPAAGAVSRGVSSSSLPSSSSLLLLTDLPVGSAVGSAAAVLLCPPWSHFPLISEHEVHSLDKMHLQCLIRVKEPCVGNIPYTFRCNSMLAASSPTGLQVTDETWSLLGSREAKYSRITVHRSLSYPE